MTDPSNEFVDVANKKLRAVSRANISENKETRGTYVHTYRRYRRELAIAFPFNQAANRLGQCRRKLRLIVKSRFSSMGIRGFVNSLDFSRTEASKIECKIRGVMYGDSRAAEAILYLVIRDSNQP